MDWLYILMPIAGVKIFWPGLIILGIGVGVIGGFFGMRHNTPLVAGSGCALISFKTARTIPGSGEGISRRA